MMAGGDFPWGGCSTNGRVVLAGGKQMGQSRETVVEKSGKELCRFVEAIEVVDHHV